MKVKFKICLSAVLTVCVFFFMTTVEAQIYTPAGGIQGSSGSANVGIGVNNPLSRLAIGAPGNATQSLYSFQPQTSGGNISVYGNSGGTTGGASSAYGLLGNVVSGRGYTYGVQGRATRSTASSSGRAYGVYGRASNSNINYGLFGIIEGDNRGAAVFGTTAASNSGTALFQDRWAGYFVGQVKMVTSLSIGTTNAPSGYILAVDGEAIVEGITVQMSNFWDEVFEEDYDLMTMEEKEAFTKANKHLPSFAPEKEIVENGIEVGDSYALMAKELEEAYQYIFELNKLTKELNGLAKELKAENEEIKLALDEIKK